MLSLQFIREQPDAVRKALADRHTPGPVDEMLALDERVRALKTETEGLRAEQNAAGKKIGAAKDAGERQRMIDEMKASSTRIDELAPELREAEERLDALLLGDPEHPGSGHAARRRARTTTSSRSSTARSTPTPGGSRTGSSARRSASSTSSAASEAVGQPLLRAARRGRAARSGR